MNSKTSRPTIGILCGSNGDAGALEEWLVAAGYVPQVVTAAAESVAAVVVRWPVPVALLENAAVPVVLMSDRGVELPPEVLQQATEVLDVPDSSNVSCLLQWSRDLQEILRHITGDSLARCDGPLPVLPRDELSRSEPELIAVGVSTGGPEALRDLLRSVSGHQLPPMAIVQHIPPKFLEQLVARLRDETGYRTEVAQNGTSLRPGVAYFAPGDKHMLISYDRDGGLVAKTSVEPPIRGHRPAADVLFGSCAQLPIRGIGLIMTGMGRDGARELLRLREQGWATIGQDRASCAIYGMPMAACELGGVERELPLADIGNWLAMLCRAHKVS